MDITNSNVIEVAKKLAINAMACQSQCDCERLMPDFNILAQFISGCMRDSVQLDLRTIGDAMRPAFTHMLQYNSTPDVQSYSTWFASFPTWDSTQRDLARREYAANR